MVMKRYNNRKKPVIFNNGNTCIDNIFELEKIGSGHDGIVFRFNNLALKLLKYDITLRKDKSLMTYDKAIAFMNRLYVKRTTKPLECMFDEDGIFCGIVMDYIFDVTSSKDLSLRRDSGDFTCRELLECVYDLYDDFSSFTESGILVEDLNRGSYIYSYDYVHLCDMDKFKILSTSSHNIYDNNINKFNFYIAKLLYFEMIKDKSLSKEDLRQLSKWVRQVSNGRNFILSLEKSIGTLDDTKVGDFSKSMCKSILHR